MSLATSFNCPSAKDPLASEGAVHLEMRSLDQLQTVLGVAEQWSAGLMTILDLMQHANQLMVVVWGDERVCIQNLALQQWISGSVDAAQSVDEHATIALSINRSSVLQSQIGEAVAHVFSTGQAVSRNQHPWQGVGCSASASNGSRPSPPIRYCNETYSPIYDASGVVGGVVGLFADITPQVATEPSQQRTAIAQPHTADPFPTAHDILERITDAFVAFDQDWRYTYVNSEAARLVGMPREALLGKRIWHDVFVEDADSASAHQLQQALIEQTPISMEVFSPVLGRYLEINAYPSPDGISIYFRDIGDRKQIERQLRNSEEFNQRIIDSSQDCIKVLDLEGRLLSINAGGKTLLEICDFEPLHLTHWIDIWQGDERVAAQHAIASAKAGQSSRFQGWSPTQSGTLKWWDVIVTPMFNDQGEVEQLLALSRDVTTLKHAEDELAIERTRFEAVLKQMPAGVILADAASNHLVLVNEQMQHITQHTYRQTQDLTQLNAYRSGQPDYRYRLNDWPLMRSLHTGETITGEQIAIQLADSSQLILDVTAAPIRNPEGQIIAAVQIVQDITTREQAKAALQRQKEELRLIADSVPALIAYVDTDYRYRFVNQAFSDWFGQPETLILGLRLEEFIGAEAYQFMQSDVSRVLAGEPIFSELWMPFRDGGHRYVRRQYIPDVNAEGVVQGFYALVTDITDLKLIETALRQSEERYRALVSIHSSIIWSMDCEGQFITAQQAWEAYTGQLWADYQGWGWLAAIHPDDRESVKADWISARDTRRIYRSEGRIWHQPSQSYHYFEAQSLPMCNADGSVREWLGMIIDVNDRKRSEEALRRSEERFRLAARAVAGVVYDWDVQNNHVYRSEGLYRLIGIRPEDVPQDRDWWTERIHPDDLNHIQPIMEAILSGSSNRYEFEYRVRHEHGYWVNVWDRGYVIRNESTIVRVVGSTNDISERKQAEVEREQILAREREARAEAEKANRIKDEFLAVLSHELRSPLNPILGWSTLLQRRRVSDEMLAQALKTIERNVKLQVQLIDDLLDVSRILRGKLHLSMNPVDLSISLKAAIETIRLAAEAKSIQVKMQIDPNIGQILGDAGRVQQIIWNLLSNAIKFTPSGGVITVRLIAVDSDIQIQVQDTGKGIKPEFLPYVFEYFRQEDGTTTRQFGGLGLGLAIVRYLTEMHGGTIWVDSPGEGLGATFTVSLPRLHSTNPSARPAYSNPVEASAPNALEQIHVLVIEDEPDSRDFIALMLEQASAQVTTAGSAQEALELLTHLQPDIIISDIGMPGMDGYMMLQQLRSLSPAPCSTIPAIALTAYAGETDAQKAIAVGFQRHLSKPIEPNRLIKAILELVR